MNKIILIGNLTRDPEMRTTSTGINVCSFTVAVNKRKRQQNEHPEADYFRVSAWRELAELCQKYLTKGKKVAITGSVSVSTYEGKDGTTKANMEVMADSVEFLSQKDDAAPAATNHAAKESNHTDLQVDEDELPF